MEFEGWRFDPGGVPVRGVLRAAMLLGMWVAPEEPALIVLDAGGREFVRVPDVPAGLPLCLSRDGTAVLLLGRYGGEEQGGLCRVPLGGGERLWFDARAAGQDLAAAMSPGGGRIATLTSSGDEEVSVTLLDMSSGARRQMWAGAGGWSEESTIAWSPTGRWVSATYLSEDEEWASVVVDVTGKAGVREYPGARTLPSANGAWTSRSGVYLHDEDAGIAVVDVESGARRAVNGHASTGLAVLGGRLFGHVVDDDPERIVVTDLDGESASAVVWFQFPVHLDAFDIVPDVWESLLQE